MSYSRAFKDWLFSLPREKILIYDRLKDESSPIVSDVSHVESPDKIQISVADMQDTYNKWFNNETQSR